MTTRGTSESEDEIGVKDKKAILSDGGVFETEDDKLRLKSLPENAFILGIETSCDDTAAAVVRSDGTILGESVKSQHEVHAKYGGIVPGLAKEAHELAIDAVGRSRRAEERVCSPL